MSSTTPCGHISDTQALSCSLRTRVRKLRRNVLPFLEGVRRWIQVPSSLGEGTSNRVRLDRTRLLVTAFLISSSWYIVAQSTDRYSVQPSEGSSASPLQAPPGSDLWNQQQRLSRLTKLKQEIKDYSLAKEWSEYQESIKNNMPWWSTWPDKIPFRYPEAEVPEMPPDEEQTILGRSQQGYSPLEISRLGILYDAKKLGIQIPTEGSENDRLSEAVSAIDVEIGKGNLVVSKMSNGTQQGSLPSDTEPALPQNLQTPEAAPSATQNPLLVSQDSGAESESKSTTGTGNSIPKDLTTSPNQVGDPYSVDTGSLRVEAITEEGKPTKIVILDEPKSEEPVLQTGPEHYAPTGANDMSQTDAAQSDLPSDEQAARQLAQARQQSVELSEQQHQLKEEAANLSDQLDKAQNQATEIQAEDQRSYEASLRSAESEKTSHTTEFQPSVDFDPIAAFGGWSGFLQTYSNRFLKPSTPSLAPRSNSTYDPCAQDQRVIGYNAACGSRTAPSNLQAQQRTPSGAQAPKSSGAAGPNTPAKNCSGVICCTAPQVPNPAAIACLNAPLFIPGTTIPNNCQRSKGGGYIPFCI